MKLVIKQAIARYFIYYSKVIQLLFAFYEQGNGILTREKMMS